MGYMLSIYRSTITDLIYDTYNKIIGLLGGCPTNHNSYSQLSFTFYILHIQLTLSHLTFTLLSHTLTRATPGSTASIYIYIWGGGGDLPPTKWPLGKNFFL